MTQILQSAKEPTAAQRRALEAFSIQYRGRVRWYFTRFSNDIFLIVPHKSYRIRTNGVTTKIHSNWMGAML